LLSDVGVHASDRVAAGIEFPGRWSVFDTFGSAVGVTTVLIVALLASAVVVVRPAWRGATVSTAILFVCLASLNSRAPFAVSSAEMYLVVLSFWVLVASGTKVSTSFLRMLRCQVGLVYAIPLAIRFFRGGDSWLNGSAIRRVVDNQGIGRGPLADVVSHLPDFVLVVATWGVLALEVAIVVVVFAMVAVPTKVPVAIRNLTLRVGLVLHFFIALVCGLWFFSAVAGLGLAAALCLRSEATTSRVRMAPAFVVTLCVVCWNILSISASPATAAGQQRNVASFVVRGLGITQVWGVFSPNPPRVDRWVEIVDERGRIVVGSRRATDRIRKLAQNVIAQPIGPLAEAWLAAECRTGAVGLVVGVEGLAPVEVLRREC
jgi:hypothetical protein